MAAHFRANASVATWTQLRRRGFSEAKIKAQLEARRWQRCGYAIVLHNGPLETVERWSVARVHGGPGALLTSFTSLEGLGLQGWERDTVHVLTRAGTRASPRSPVPLRLHRVRDWSRVRRSRSGPLHSAAQSVLLAAASFRSPRPACGIVAAVVQQRLVTPARLALALEATGSIRHRALLRTAIGDIGQGAQALSEIDFVRLCRAHRLPLPEHQTVRREPNGRRRYLDATWRRSDGRLVVVEVDGALHLDQRRWWDDQLRQNELVLGDAIVLRFPSAVVRTRPDVVAAQLRRALRC